MSEMQPIPNSAGAIVYLVDQLNKYRSLTDFELDILCLSQGGPRQARARIRAEYRAWMPADDATLLKMKREGRTSNAIGAKLGRSAYSVRCRLRRLNMEKRHG